MGTVAIKFSFGPWPLGDIVAIVVGARIGSAFKVKDGVLLSASIGATTGIYLGYLATSDFPPLEIKIVGILIAMCISAVLYATVGGIVIIFSIWLTKGIIFLFSRTPKSLENQITFDKDALLTNTLSILVVLNIAGLIFTSRSVMQSVTALIVGWAQILAWLIEIARNRATPGSNKPRAYLGMLVVIAVLFSFWAWLGIRQENKENALPNDNGYATPDNAFTLPTAKEAGISVYVDSWSSDRGEQILNQEIDRETVVQEINQSWLGQQVSLLGYPVSLRIYIEGLSEEQIRIESKFPIKLVSYSPIVSTTDIVRPRAEDKHNSGFDFFYLHFPKQLESNSVYQATFIDYQIYNVRALFNDLVASGEWQDLPLEIQAVATETNNNNITPPDVFRLNPKEEILFYTGVSFNTPGVYEIQPGIVYVYMGERYVAWAESTITIEVPQTYYVWQVFAERDDKLVIGLEEFCQPDQNLIPQCTYTTITRDSLEAVGIERFSIEHKTVDSVEKFTVTDNLPSFYGGSILGVWSPTREIFALNSEEGIYLYSLDSIQSPKFLERPQASKVIFSNNGEFLATGGVDGKVELWKSSKGIRLFELESHFLPVSAMTFSPDVSLLVSASRDTTVNVSRVSDGKILLKLFAKVYSDPMSGAEVEEIGFSPDMRFLYTRDDIGVTTMWTFPDGKPFARFQDLIGTDELTRALEFSPDSKQIALLTSGGSGRVNLTLWSLEDGSLVLSKPNFTDILALGLEFSMDGKLLAVLQYTTNLSVPDEWKTYLVLYETSSGKEIGRFDLSKSTMGDSWPLAFSPDNKFLASFKEDGGLLVWRISDGQLILDIDTDISTYELEIEFSPDGLNLILSSGLEREIRRVSDGKLISVLKTKSSAP